MNKELKRLLKIQDLIDNIPYWVNEKFIYKNRRKYSTPIDLVDIINNEEELQKVNEILANFSATAVNQNGRLRIYQPKKVYKITYAILEYYGYKDNISQFNQDLRFLENKEDVKNITVNREKAASELKDLVRTIEELKNSRTLKGSPSTLEKNELEYKEIANLFVSLSNDIESIDLNNKERLSKENYKQRQKTLLDLSKSFKSIEHKANTIRLVLNKTYN